MQEDQHIGAILENICDQLTVIREGQAAMACVPEDIRVIKDSLKHIKSDIKVIEAALVDAGYEINDHETRITHLKAA